MKTEEICVYHVTAPEAILPRAALFLIVLIACISIPSGVLYARELDSAEFEKTMLAVRADAPLSGKQTHDFKTLRLLKCTAVT